MTDTEGNCADALYTPFVIAGEIFRAAAVDTGCRRALTLTGFPPRYRALHHGTEW